MFRAAQPLRDLAICDDGNISHTHTHARTYAHTHTHTQTHTHTHTHARTHTATHTHTSMCQAAECCFRQARAPRVPVDMWPSGAGASIVPVQMCRVELSPGADVAGVSPVPARMWLTIRDSRRLDAVPPTSSDACARLPAAATTGCRTTGMCGARILVVHDVRTCSMPCTAPGDAHGGGVWARSWRRRGAPWEKPARAGPSDACRGTEARPPRTSARAVRCDGVALAP